MTLKIFMVIFVICVLFLVPLLLLANQTSKENQAPGLLEEQLRKCPDKPNCINTEYPEDKNHYLSAIDFPESKKEQILVLASSVILNMGGTIIKATTQNNTQEKDLYLAATFTSSLFRFIDDFELRQDNTTHKLHFRSASRTGYSDFGVNKRRVKQFTKQFQTILNQK
ncbi:MAG: DUF1499 domain-containing protein [Gammaproteobacteria bacterium]|nr:DUF1499 domain-containing protein [Gammaproteobacteria bacterium]